MRLHIRRALYTGIGQLIEDLMNHIHLENNVLFPYYEAKVRQNAGGCGGSGLPVQLSTVSRRRTEDA